MPERTVRPIRSEDFGLLMRMEEEVFGSSGERVLGPYYVRLCCEFFSDSCSIAFDEAYCTTLAVAPAYQGTRVAFLPIRALISSLMNRCESCRFTVKEDNLQARSLHEALGATEMGIREAFYGPVDRRLVSRIDRQGFERLRARFERMGLVGPGGSELERAVANGPRRMALGAA